jgi:hypothetical protein
VPRPDPSVCEASFIPSALGDYTFRLIGAVNGTPIDESFSSSPTTFASVEPLDRYQFPVDAPAAAEIVARLDAANARLARSETLPYVGIAAGIIGLLVGLGALLGPGKPPPGGRQQRSLTDPTARSGGGAHGENPYLSVRY